MRFVPKRKDENMNNTQFKAWRKRHNLSSRAAANILGIIEPRTIRRYEAGEIPVSGPVSRLCILIEEVLRIYRAKVAFLGGPAGIRLARPQGLNALEAVEAAAVILKRAGLPVEIDT